MGNYYLKNDSDFFRLVMTCLVDVNPVIHPVKDDLLKKLIEAGEHQDSLLQAIKLLKGDICKYKLQLTSSTSTDQIETYAIQDEEKIYYAEIDSSEY